MRIFELKNLIPLCIVFFIVSCKSTDDKAQWAQQGGGDSYDGGRGLSVDSKGNVYVVGRYQGSAQFGDKTITGKGDDGMFLAKYNREGALLWVKEAGGAGDDSGYDLTIDKNDNIYVAGYFADTAYFDSNTLTSKGEDDAYLAKYDSTGKILWVKQAGGTMKDVARGVACDETGNCYVTGYFTGTISFDTMKVSSNGMQEDAFIACYDAAGKIKWAKNAGGKGNDRAFALTLDKEGNLCISGIFNDTAFFDSMKVASAAVEDMFVAKYNKNGGALWVKRGGGDGSDEAKSVAVDKQNNIYVTGYFLYEMDFGPDVTEILKSIGDRDIFVVKYDAKGNFVWARSMGGPNVDEGSYVISSNEEGCMVSGFYGNNAVFGDSTLPCKGISDVFVAQFSGDGKLGGLMSAGSEGVDEGRSIKIIDKNYFYLAGNYGGELVIGEDIKLPKSRGDGDMFVAKLRMEGRRNDAELRK